MVNDNKSGNCIASEKQADFIQPCKSGPHLCIPALVPGNDSLHLFTEGDVLYEAMLGSISRARNNILLESYIFSDDEIGWKFAETLAEKARAGLEVLLHLDAAGTLLRGGRKLGKYLRGHNVDIKWFHRWSWFDPLRYNRRQHRKLLVVDKSDAYIGGFNIHRQSSHAVFGRERWRDAHVRFGNSLALQAAEMFYAFWDGDVRWTMPENNDATSVLVPNSTAECRYLLNCFIISMLVSARHFVYLTTPYFVPDNRTLKVLTDSAGRGVDVRILVPAKSNVPLAHWAGHHLYSTLLNAGVRIYEYQPGLMHAKTIVVDNSWGTVGSSNFDYRSFFSNYELNMITRDNVLCRKLRNHFLEDLSQAEEVTDGRWSARGLTSQILESAGWLLRRWL
ncbi:MAG: phosphatidylserine/phosphatidylglycerophosphate/cardiolipin synthase family protein [Nitrospirae bacterium]|nr:phosphatidylserine/phosphatidylglycerophosphate/cardiolipin synthase family protein [Nitrospirota bacterium]